MDGTKELDRARIEEALRVMGQYLLDRNALGEIAIYGGSAILFQFHWRRTSEDVDARILSAGHHGLVIRAAEAAAKQLNLPRSWLSESVTMYARRLEQDNDRTFVGVYPSAERVGLRVMAAKPHYILAMKLNALERTTADDRDFEDGQFGSCMRRHHCRGASRRIPEILSGAGASRNCRPTSRRTRARDRTTIRSLNGRTDVTSTDAG